MVNIRLWFKSDFCLLFTLLDSMLRRKLYEELNILVRKEWLISWILWIVYLFDWVLQENIVTLWYFRNCIHFERKVCQVRNLTRSVYYHIDFFSGTKWNVKQKSSNFGFVPYLQPMYGNEVIWKWKHMRGFDFIWKKIKQIEIKISNAIKMKNKVRPSNEFQNDRI